MSVPWGWLGNWFPFLEGTIDPDVVSVGNGTPYCVEWTNVLGSTADSEISAFEWTASQLSVTVTGTAYLPFDDPGGGTQTGTCDFSLTFSVDAMDYVGSNDWSLREPNDYVDAGLSGSDGVSFSGSGVISPALFSLPSGGTATGSISFTLVLKHIAGEIGTEIGSPVIGFSKYIKACELYGQIAGGGNIISVSTDQNSPNVPTSPLTNDGGEVSFLHGTPHIFWEFPSSGGSVVFSSASVSISDSYTQPPAIA